MSQEISRLKQKISSYISYYDGVINKLLNDLDAIATFSGIKLIPQKNEDDKIELCCLFEKLPLGGIRASDADIAAQYCNDIEFAFITARIEFNSIEKKLFVKQYNTEVGFFKKLDGKKTSPPFDLEYILGLHYDFDSSHYAERQDSSYQINHPVFHVQQGNKCGWRLFEKDKYKSVIESKYRCNRTEQNSEMEHLRIPTPQMDIFSVIVSIIADYLIHPTDPEHRKHFSKFLDDIQKHIIPFDFSSLSNARKEFKDNKLNIGHWYPCV